MWIINKNVRIFGMNPTEINRGGKMINTELNFLFKFLKKDYRNIFYKNYLSFKFFGS